MRRLFPSAKRQSKVVLVLVLTLLALSAALFGRDIRRGFASFASRAQGSTRRTTTDLASVPVGTRFALARLKPVTETISGTVSLQDYSGTVAGTVITFEIRAVGAVHDTEVDTATLDASGNYSFATAVTPGTYNIGAKGPHWLRQIQRNRIIPSLGLTGVNFSLINGDIDGSNVVDTADYTILKAAFGSLPGDSNWNPNADLDGDGAVGLSDFAILKGNLGKEGDHFISGPIDIAPNPPGGFLPDSMTLPPWEESAVPVDESDAPGGGPGATISVSLPHGVTDVDSGPDLVIDNPRGSDIVFERHYRSALAAGNLSSPGLPPGWTHNWDFKIVPLTPGSWGPLQLVYPNGASEMLTPVLDSNKNPTGQFGVPGAGAAPYILTGSPNLDPTQTGVWSSFTFQHNGLAREVFNMPAGDTSVYRLQTRVLSNGQQLNFTYSSGNLIQVDNASPSFPNPNAKLILSYSGSGLLQGASDSASGNYRAYDCSTGELGTVSLINGGAAEWTYSYTNLNGQPYVHSVQTYDPQGGISTAAVAYDQYNGRPSSVVDGKGDVRSYGYSDNGTASVSVTAAGAATPEDSEVISFDSSNRETAVTDASNQTTSLTYQSVDPSVPTIVARPLGVPFQVTTDSHGNTTRVDYPYGNHTDITWDYPSDMPLGRITQVQEFGRSGESKAPVQYTYCGVNDLAGPDGFLKRIDYAYGGFVAYTYTALGSVATVTGPTTQVTYGYTTRFSGVNAIERVGMPYSATDWPTNTHSRTTWFDYDANGNLVWSRSPMGHETSISPNQYGQPAQINMPMGQQLRFAYSVNGKPPTSASASGPTGTVPLFTNQYDGESAAHVSTDGSNRSSTSNLDGRFGLSNLVNGNSVAAHSFLPLPSARQFQATIGSGIKSLSRLSSFDANGSLTSVAPVAGAPGDTMTATVTPNQIDGLRDYPSRTDLSITSPIRGLGTQSIQYTYDGFGRPTDGTGGCQLQAPNNGPYIANSDSFNFAYDDLDRLTTDGTVTHQYNPDGTLHSTSFGMQHRYYYDGVLRVTRVEAYDPYYNVIRAWANYAYDDDDRVLSVRTPKATTLYAYNDLGQITSLQNLTPDNTTDPYQTGGSITEPDGTYHSLLSQFTNITYDSLGNRTGMHIDAEIQEGWQPNPSSGDPGANTLFGSGDVHFTYDGAGRLTQELWSGFGPTTTLNHVYDGAGNLTTLRNQAFGVDSSVDQATSSPLVEAATIDYDDSGETAGLSRSDRYDHYLLYYELTGQLAWLNGHETFCGWPPTGPIGQEGISVSPGWTYDKTFSSDSEDRLTGMYTAGGFFGESVQGFTMDGPMIVARSHSLASGWSPVWDATDLPYEWYYANSDGADVSYLWGPTGPIMEYDAYGNSRTFTWDPQGNCVGAAGLSRQTYIDSQNHIHNVDGVTEYPIFYDGYGLPVWYYRYDSSQPSHGGRNSAFPFGINGGGGARWFVQPFQYKGQFGYYTDSESALIYCHHRWYNPQTGRWLTRDPIGLEGGVNPYEYCGGNPVTGADPSGLQGLMDNPMIQFQRTFNQYMGTDTKGGEQKFWRGMAEGMPGFWGAELKMMFGPPDDMSMFYRGGFEFTMNWFGPALGAEGPELEVATLPGESALGQLDRLAGVGPYWRTASEMGNLPNKLVLGKYPGYLQVGDRLGAKTFSIPANVWEKMSPAAREAANFKCLDRAAARGTDIVFSNPAVKQNLTGSFGKEVAYLRGKGYVFTHNRMGMYLPK